MNDVERMQADAVMRAKEMYNRRTPTYNTGYNGNIKYQPKQTNTAYAQNTQNTQNTSICTCTIRTRYTVSCQRIR